MVIPRQSATNYLHKINVGTCRRRIGSNAPNQCMPSVRGRVGKVKMKFNGAWIL